MEESWDRSSRPFATSFYLTSVRSAASDSASNNIHFESLDPDIVHRIIRRGFGLSLLEQSIESINTQSVALLPFQAMQEEC